MTPAIIRTIGSPPRFRVILMANGYRFLESDFLNTLDEALAIRRQWSTVEGFEKWIEESRLKEEHHDS